MIPVQNQATMAEWSKATDLRSVTRRSAQVRTLLVALLRNLTASLSQLYFKNVNYRFLKPTINLFMTS